MVKGADQGIYGFCSCLWRPSSSTASDPSFRLEPWELVIWFGLKDDGVKIFRVGNCHSNPWGQGPGANGSDQEDEWSMKFEWEVTHEHILDFGARISVANFQG